MKYRYYHSTMVQASTPAGILKEYDEKKKKGGTIFSKKSDLLKPLVEAGFVMEEELPDDYEDEVEAPETDTLLTLCTPVDADPVKVVGEVVTDPPKVEGDITIVEPVEKIPLKTKAELEEMSFAELRLYARGYGIKGTSYKEILDELLDAGKIA